MAAKRVKVEATRNLDFLNTGEVVELERDERVAGLIDAGYLREVDADAEVTGEVASVEPDEDDDDDVDDVPKATKVSEPTVRRTGRAAGR